MPNPVIVALAAVVGLVVVLRAVGAVRSSEPRVPVEHERTSVGLAPRTRMGWWSVGSALAYVLLLASMDLVPGLDPFRSEPDLLTLAQRLLFGVTAGAAVVTGMIAVRRRGDRSVLVYLAIALTAWVGLIPVLGSFFFE